MAEEAPAETRQHLVLDACCIITLAATGEFEAVLASLSMQGVVAAYVMQVEALSYIGPDGTETPIRLEPLLASGLLISADIDITNQAEPELVIALEAQKLDAGEEPSRSTEVGQLPPMISAQSGSSAPAHRLR